ncbi:MAG TPA: hypothetical protein VFS23_32325 [Vicinamibacterales bacterium]|nr:hypothetical protein [Vicinamibacterales bacterium]
MSASDDLSGRLRELDRILSHEGSTSFSNEGDPVSLHLGAVPSERIRELTSLLGRTTVANDEIDVVAMRLLLNDYTSAVGHLRAVARSAATRIDEAATPVREAQLFMKRDQRREERIERKRERDARDQPQTPRV